MFRRAVDTKRRCATEYGNSFARTAIVLERLARGGARTLQAYTAHGGYRALEQALGKPREEIVDAIEISGLRGRGGAGFPTGRKWRAVAQQDSP